ncbi:hypothetical protein LZG04_22860 [Saccharothrix sp. S26]|uniref:hypothetical protein n=1 Tax=Saccharothrix sp. S26 TaxID=2907215 RepID=UPI001F3CFC54|nr:hypothetical protein [Saccharothrix sp. S26]MCE6997615.1 hypothetical protein [Saccharothrix sp. S26]
MTDQDVPQADGGEQDQPEQVESEQPAVALNRAARRGHAQKNDGVNKIPGRPHQNTFVGRRVFRRTSGG